jgi:hypothetical protein
VMSMLRFRVSTFQRRAALTSDAASPTATMTQSAILIGFALPLLLLIFVCRFPLQIERQ